LEEAARKNDEAQSRRRGAESQRGSAAADVAGSVHFQKEKCDGCFSYTFCYAGEAGGGALRNRRVAYPTLAGILFRPHVLRGLPVLGARRPPLPWPTHSQRGKKEGEEDIIAST